MRVNKIKEFDTANGIGISCTVFFQGCIHHCPYCFNKETWDFNEGVEFTEEIQQEFINKCKSKYVSSISILGGDPFNQPANELLEFLKQLHELNKQVFLWTGYKFENIPNPYRECLNYIDILIDGEFQEDKKDLSLRFAGSTNQRVIDVKKTLKSNEIVLFTY